ncbi:hypothetical protein TRIUR3_15336 [Triticum urartu]|uniref:Uncharacterized protein n=2 Tax=Triticum TaxID=4564 RepID=A0A9R0TU71_TRITD|nr:hypothetical protein TRIUR3_15336 [Triticum urartu]VAI18551.1 unnamed protein product [Triticum turgidum subsp. durum]
MSPSESLPEGSEDSDASSDTQSEDTQVVAEENGTATPKPIRRSASMDSPLFLVVVPEGQGGALQANRKLPSGRQMSIFRAKEKEAAGTSSSSCQTGGFKIGRSMSSSGRGLFFSRNGRSTGNVLPLVDHCLLQCILFLEGGGANDMRELENTMLLFAPVVKEEGAPE